MYCADTWFSKKWVWKWIILRVNNNIRIYDTTCKFYLYRLNTKINNIFANFLFSIFSWMGSLKKVIGLKFHISDMMWKSVQKRNIFSLDKTTCSYILLSRIYYWYVWNCNEDNFQLGSTHYVDSKIILSNFTRMTIVVRHFTVLHGIRTRNWTFNFSGRDRTNILICDTRSTL